MTAKDALKNEILKRRVQLDKLAESLDQAGEEDAGATQGMILLRRAKESLVAAEARIEQGKYDDAFYLFAQGCWNLGCAHGTSRRL